MGVARPGVSERFPRALSVPDSPGWPAVDGSVLGVYAAALTVLPAGSDSTEDLMHPGPAWLRAALGAERPGDAAAPAGLAAAGAVRVTADPGASGVPSCASIGPIPTLEPVALLSLYTGA